MYVLITNLFINSYDKLKDIDLVYSFLLTFDPFLPSGGLFA